MRLKLNDVRPGMVLWDDTSPPYVIDVEDSEYDTVRSLTFGSGSGGGIEVTVVTGRGTDHGKPTDEVTVADTPPRVMMSWSEFEGCWAILIDTTNGSGQTKLDVALNDAELFNGVTDPIEEPEPRIVSAGYYQDGKFVVTDED